MPDPASRKAAVLSLLTRGGIKSSLSASDIEQIVHLTKNFSYSDLAALTREAALFPIRELGEIGCISLSVFQLGDKYR